MTIDHPFWFLRWRHIAVILQGALGAKWPSTTNNRCPRSLCKKGCRWCYIFRLLLVPVVSLERWWWWWCLFLLLASMSRVWQSSYLNIWISRFGRGKREFSKWCLSAKIHQKSLISRDFSRQFCVIFAYTYFSSFCCWNSKETRKMCRARTLSQKWFPAKIIFLKQEFRQTLKTWNKHHHQQPTSSTQQHAAARSTSSKY